MLGKLKQYISEAQRERISLIARLSAIITLLVMIIKYVFDAYDYGGLYISLRRFQGAPNFLQYVVEGLTLGVLIFWVTKFLCCMFVLVKGILDKRGQKI